MSKTVTEFDVKVHRKIEVIDLNIGNYKLYKDTRTFNTGEKIQIYQGITENEISSLLDKIQNAQRVYLIAKENLEKYRQGDTWIKRELIDENVFDIYESNSEQYEIVKCIGNELVYLNGRLVSHHVGFGRFYGLTTSSMYDIDGLKEYLKSQPNRFKDIKDHQWSELQGSLRELNFTWIPDEDEYNIFIKSIQDIARSDVKQYLGIEKFLKKK